jgi:hypothetical protein
MANLSFSRLWSATMAAYKTFRQAYASSDQANLGNFESWEARKLRYSLLWAMYENTAYDKIHTWAISYKTQYGLYEAIRNIYNPSYRLGEFWKSHLLAGKLDPKAGDGSSVPSAIPIVTESEELRAAIAKVWEWSNWQVKKDVFSLWTPVMGDGIIQVIDDPQRKKVYKKVVHPSRLKEITLDAWGNVKGYVYEYSIPDPRQGKSSSATYREVCTHESGDEVVYKTYLNEAPYAYGGMPEEWAVSYGFVPVVFLKHNDVGLDFGWSEIYPGLSKFREADDQASKLNDQIRKEVEGAWLFAGVSNPKKTPTITGQAASQTETEKSENPYPGREEIKALYSTNPDAKAHSLVSNLNIADASANIQMLLEELERDFPELRVDLANATGDISGRALRLNRGPAETKVLQRRPNYDNAIVRANQMAVAIGGFRQYDAAFAGFGLESYAAGDLEHSIGERPVFAPDPADESEEDAALWNNANAAKSAGVPLAVYLELKGWSPEKIAKVTNSEEYKMRQESMKLSIEGLRVANSGDGFVPQNQNKNQDDEDQDGQ